MSQLWQLYPAPNASHCLQPPPIHVITKTIFSPCTSSPHRDQNGFLKNKSIQVLLLFSMFQWLSTGVRRKIPDWLPLVPSPSLNSPASTCLSPPFPLLLLPLLPPDPAWSASLLQHLQSWLHSISFTSLQPHHLLGAFNLPGHSFLVVPYAVLALKSSFQGSGLYLV